MSKEGMIDNRKVGASKGGIHAKMQKGKTEKTWQSGDMGEGMKSHGKWHSDRGASLTPRKA